MDMMRLHVCLLKATIWIYCVSGQSVSPIVDHATTSAVAKTTPTQSANANGWVDKGISGLTTCSNPNIYSLSDVEIVSRCTQVGTITEPTDQELGSIQSLNINASIAGPIIIQNVQTILGALITWDGGISSLDSNGITSLSMPDLEDVNWTIAILNETRISDISLPKLKHISGNLVIGVDRYDYSKAPRSPPDTPPLDLAFPSLQYVGGSIDIIGNIDSLELPAITRFSTLQINSTGELDCSSLVSAVTRPMVTRLPYVDLYCFGKNGDASVDPIYPERSSTARITSTSASNSNGATITPAPTTPAAPSESTQSSGAAGGKYCRMAFLLLGVFCAFLA